MDCPICKNQMTKGVLTPSGVWLAEGSFRAKIVGIDRIIGSNKANRIWAFRCEHCGKVELTTDVSSSA